MRESNEPTDEQIRKLRAYHHARGHEYATNHIIIATRNCARCEGITPREAAAEMIEQRGMTCDS